MQSLKRFPFALSNILILGVSTFLSLVSRCAGNELGDAAIEQISRSLSINTSIVHLHLSGTQNRFLL